MNARTLFVLVIGISLLVNLIAIDWGLPSIWEADTILPLTLEFASRGTLEPRSFAKPTLYPYTLGAVLLPYFLYLKFTDHPLDPEALKFSFPDVWKNIFIIARLLSAFLATASVALVFLIGKNIANDRAGFIAALLLALAPGVVTTAHFSGLDVPLLFFVTLSLALLIWSFKRPSLLYAASLAAGLATAVKYPGALLAVPIALTVFLQKCKIIKTGFATATCMFLGFVIGMPWIVLSPAKFFAQFHRFFSVSGYYGLAGEIGFIQHAYNLWYILGPGIVLLLVGAIVAFRSRDKRVWILLAWVFAMYAFFGFWRNAPLRFILPLVPAGVVLAGIAVARHRALQLITGMLLFAMLIGTLGVLSQFLHDSRAESEYWIRELPAGSRIHAFSQPGYMPRISVTREHFDGLPHKLPYTGAFPFGEPRFNVSYDLESTNYSIVSAYDRMVCTSADADYVLLSEFTYGRFLGTHDFVQGISSATSYPDRTAFFTDLLNEQLGFTIVKEFKHETWFDLNPPFVNPRIVVLQKTGNVPCTAAP